MLRWLAVFAIALAIYLPGSSAPFSNTAESQEALVAWEMIQGGDWILPRVNGELIPSKPPFYHWIVAAFSTLTGDIDELTARLPSIVAAAACVTLVYGIGAQRWRPLTGIIAAVVLATSPEWAKWATTARTDATFSFLLTASLLLGERWLRKGDLRTLLALAAVTGAATLAKGFAAAGLVALVLAVGIWRRGEWQRLHPLPLLSAAAVFGAIAGSWYAAALAREGSAFFHKQIVLENVLRFLPNEEGGPSRHHSWLFYVPMIFTGMLPWSLALPSALRRAHRERFTVEAFPAYLLIWITVVFSVCTMASGKRTNYVLPLYPAAALLVGRQLAVLLERSNDGRQFPLRTAGWMSAGLLAVVSALLVAWQAGMEPWGPILPWLHPQDRLLLPKMLAVVGHPGKSAILLCAGIERSARSGDSAKLLERALCDRWNDHPSGDGRCRSNAPAPRIEAQVLRTILAPGRGRRRNRPARFLRIPRSRRAVLSPPARPGGTGSVLGDPPAWMGLGVVEGLELAPRLGARWRPHRREEPARLHRARGYETTPRAARRRTLIHSSGTVA